MVDDVEPSMVLSPTIAWMMSVELRLCQYKDNLDDHIAIVFEGPSWLLEMGSKQNISAKKPRWAASEVLMQKSRRKRVFGRLL